MTTYFVDAGRPDDTGNGLTIATAKKTLSAVEALPTAAGDIINIKSGTYRELLTPGVSGTAGNLITYIGDYTGSVFGGAGGVIRITGSADDIALTRANCVTATSKDYRSFKGILFDGSSGALLNMVTACTGWVIENCVFHSYATGAVACISVGGTGTGNTIQNCYLLPGGNGPAILFTHSATVNAAGHLVQNCIALTGQFGVQDVRVGGVTVKNNVFMGRGTGVIVSTALAVGQTVTVNNNLFHAMNVALSATAIGEIVEDFNNIVACVTARTNTNTGANSKASFTMFDTRAIFQLMFAGAGPNSVTQFLSPYDLAAASPLINVAGTSPSTTDLRGTAIQGAQREWGSLEYDSTLKIAGSAASGGGIMDQSMLTGGFQ